MEEDGIIFGKVEGGDRGWPVAGAVANAFGRVFLFSKRVEDFEHLQSLTPPHSFASTVSLHAFRQPPTSPYLSLS